MISINTVTQEQVDDAIASVSFTTLGLKTTVGLCTLKNGFEICMSSSCVDPANYDADIGSSLVLHKIKDEIWKLLGFQLQHNLSVQEQPAAPEAPAADPVPAGEGDAQ